METDNAVDHFSNAPYFVWLCDQIAMPHDAPSYLRALSVMFATEFVWVIGNDENRVSDGRDLRSEYLDHAGVLNREDIEIDKRPVSFLEVLIGLSKRVAFLVDQDPRDWAWHFMKVLGLDRFNDGLGSTDLRQVSEVLERVIWRNYEPSGSGGFFPLSNPMDDQRKVEIWDQMNTYIGENRESFGL